MNYSGEAAEQVVRMSLEGTEMVLKLTGSAAKHLAVMLYAVVKDQEKTKGQTRLANMLKSGKELKVYAVRDQDLEAFHKEAKHYGILYTTLKNKSVDDGITDIMIKAEDAGIFSRLFERLQLKTADKGLVKTQIESQRAEKEQEAEKPLVITSRDDIENFMDAALSKPSEKSQNPSADLIGADRQSSPSSTEKEGSKAVSSSEAYRKPSVKKELEEIRTEQKKAAAEKVISKGRSTAKKGKEHGR